MIGKFTLGLDENFFKVRNPPETKINYNNCDELKTSIKINDNGPKYTRALNPYEKMVNLAMIEKNGESKMSFKAKAFFEQCLFLSKDPKTAKMDSYNPIFLYMANPNEYRQYRVDHVYQ
jgi:hypothetical protein